MIFMVGFSVIKLIFNLIFGTRINKSSQERKQSGAEQKYNSSKNNTQSQNEKKIFSKDEGEYVDYEEV